MAICFIFVIVNWKRGELYVMNVVKEPFIIRINKLFKDIL